MMATNNVQAQADSLSRSAYDGFFLYFLIENNNVARLVIMLKWNEMNWDDLPIKPT